MNNEIQFNNNEPQVFFENFINNEMTFEAPETATRETRDYNKLINEPSIQGVTLTHNKTFEDLGASSLTNIEIEELINNIIL